MPRPAAPSRLPGWPSPASGSICAVHASGVGTGPTGSASVCSGVSHQVAANATTVANATPAAIHCHRAIVLRCLPAA